MKRRKTDSQTDQSDARFARLRLRCPLFVVVSAGEVGTHRIASHRISRSAADGTQDIRDKLKPTSSNRGRSGASSSGRPGRGRPRARPRVVESRDEDEEVVRAFFDRLRTLKKRTSRYRSRFFLSVASFAPRPLFGKEREGSCPFVIGGSRTVDYIPRRARRFKPKQKSAALKRRWIWIFFSCVCEMWGRTDVGCFAYPGRCRRFVIRPWWMDSWMERGVGGERSMDGERVHEGMARRGRLTFKCVVLLLLFPP